MAYSQSTQLAFPPVSLLPRQQRARQRVRTSDVYYIYALTDPRTDEVRYIGRANNPDSRLRSHVGRSSLKRNTPKNRWLGEVLAIGALPGVRILEETTAALSFEREHLQIIAHHEQGCKLTNRIAIAAGNGQIRMHQPSDSLLCLDKVYSLEQTIARFWSYVEKSEGCWLWKGGTAEGRYGLFHVTHNGRKRQIYAQRFSLLLKVKTLTPDILARHTCDNGLCVRPDHLIGGTHADNVQDMYSRGRASLKRARGVDHGNAVLTEEIVGSMRTAYRNGTRKAEMAILYGVSLGTVKKAISGEWWQHVAEPPCTALRRGSTKLTDAMVVSIRTEYDAGASTESLASQYNVHRNNIRLIVTSKTWNHLPPCENMGIARESDRRPIAKLTADQVRDFRSRCANGEKADEVGVCYGLSRSASYAIAAGKTYARVK